jgi:hypothetical protein
VVLDVVYCVGVVVAVAALYVVLRRVSRHLAVLAALWKFVHAVTAVLTALAFLSILRLAGDATYAQAFEPGSLQALVRLHSSATRDQYYVGLVFWSLSSTVFGWLWLKSRYVPAPLAVFGLASSVWCAFCALAYLIDPAFAHVVDLWWFDSPMAVFDIVLSIWLLLKGLPRSASPDAEREGGPAPAA